LGRGPAGLSGRPHLPPMCYSCTEAQLCYTVLHHCTSAQLYSAAALRLWVLGSSTVATPPPPRPLCSTSILPHCTALCGVLHCYNAPIATPLHCTQCTETQHHTLKPHICTPAPRGDRGRGDGETCGGGRDGEMGRWDGSPGRRGRPAADDKQMATSLRGAV
jgi:hypothetical protein